MEADETTSLQVHNNVWREEWRKSVHQVMDLQRELEFYKSRCAAWHALAKKFVGK